MKPQSAENGFSVTTKSADTEWYFAPKSLIHKWAKIIGPNGFLVYHYVKSLCPERGLKGEAINWTEVPPILGISSKQLWRSITTLVNIGLLESHTGYLGLPDPDEIVWNGQIEECDLP